MSVFVFQNDNLKRRQREICMTRRETLKEKEREQTVLMNDDLEIN